MDEGRLGVVIRTEERHRKSVYMMNDIIRAQFALYHNCLSREQHESSIKLVKNCVEMRRTVVRQKVLKKCLEMRKRKILAVDPSSRFGKYGGVPLWAMSRDIDRVIADNHPKLRRMRRVQDAMQKSRDSGAILDDAAVARRIETFFQLQQGRRLRDKSPERAPTTPEDLFQASSLPLRRRNDIKLPALAAKTDAHKLPSLAAKTDWKKHDADGGGSSKPHSNVQPETARSKRVAGLQHASRKDKIHTSAESSRSKNSEASETSSSISRRSSLEEARGDNPAAASVDSRGLRVASEGGRVGTKPSLNVDSKGRLRGIRTSIDTIHEHEADVEEKENAVPAQKEMVGECGRKTSGDGIEEVREANAGERKRFQQYSPDTDKSRSRLILPPIQPNKAMVSRE